MSEKIKYELEFPIQASPNMLYQYISSASNLSEWFADNVNSRGKVFSFFWDGSEEKAELISFKNNKYVRFKWLENEDDSFFEINIVVDELTKMFLWLFMILLMKMRLRREKCCGRVKFLISSRSLALLNKSND
jgi:uncharacterized protein YndB with AHSA1/START domain